MEGTSISEWVEGHAPIVIGGALVVGLLLFTMGNKPSVQQQTGLTPVAQEKPDPAVLTVEQYNSAMAQYDEEIRFFIAQRLGQGQNPPPTMGEWNLGYTQTPRTETPPYKTDPREDR